MTKQIPNAGSDDDRPFEITVSEQIRSSLMTLLRWATRYGDPRKNWPRRRDEDFLEFLLSIEKMVSDFDDETPLAQRGKFVVTELDRKLGRRASHVQALLTVCREGRAEPEELLTNLRDYLGRHFPKWKLTKGRLRRMMSVPTKSSNPVDAYDPKAWITKCGGPKQASQTLLWGLANRSPRFANYFESAKKSENDPTPRLDDTRYEVLSYVAQGLFNEEEIIRAALGSLASADSIGWLSWREFTRINPGLAEAMSRSDGPVEFVARGPRPPRQARTRKGRNHLPGDEPYPLDERTVTFVVPSRNQSGETREAPTDSTSPLGKSGSRRPKK